ANPFADFEDRPEQYRNGFKDAAEFCQSAEGETAEERFRENAQNEKINRQGDDDGPDVAGNSQPRDEHRCQQKQAENVYEIRHQQDGDQEALRLFREAVEPDRRGEVLFYLMPKADRINREQASFDPGKEKRDRPKQENGERVNHGAVAPFPSSSGSRHAVFSRRISSMRFRPARRMVTA